MFVLVDSWSSKEVTDVDKEYIDFEYRGDEFIGLLVAAIEEHDLIAPSILRNELVCRQKRNLLASNCTSCSCPKSLRKVAVNCVLTKIDK